MAVTGMIFLNGGRSFEIQLFMSGTSVHLAYLFLRLTLVVNFMMHGVARFLGGVDAFAGKIVQGFSTTILPAAIVYLYARTLPFVKIGIGLLLFLRLFTREVLAAGALVILSLIFGTSLQQNWDTVGTQMIYSVFFFLLLHFLENNRYSLGYLRKRW